MVQYSPYPLSCLLSGRAGEVDEAGAEFLDEALVGLQVQASMKIAMHFGVVAVGVLGAATFAEDDVAEDGEEVFAVGVAHDGAGEESKGEDR